MGSATVASNPSKHNRWPERRVLSEARRRTRQLNAANTAAVQHMLAELLRSAGWTGPDFVEALCRDISRNGAGC